MRISAKASSLALILCAPLAPPAQAQGIDPQLVMMMEQMISAVWMNCQMGDQASCYNAQGMQQYGQQIIAAGQYCMQTNDMNACGFYQQGVYSVQNAYMQMAQGYGGQLPATPGYDPNNPLGATHADRMQNISDWGAANTANWQAQQAQNDAAHNAFIDSIRN